MKLKYVVNPDDSFDNLRELLKSKFMISDRLILKLKKNNRFIVNGKPTLINSKVNSNDIIEINLDFDEEDSEFPATQMDLDILYEDDALLIINKPSNIPVHPSINHYSDSLANGIKYYFESIGLKRKIRPVNRIDKDTSGIVIFAKNEYVQEYLVRQMKTNDFSKEYIAICEGIFLDKEGFIDAPISRKSPSIIERCVNENGSSAITKYCVIDEVNKSNYSYSVLKCKLETGRTHQIRVHMQHIGHSILGDTLYGTTSNLISRQALHSYSVSFIHPITMQKVTYTAPLPQDMKSLCVNTKY